jgi:hypothetical protein
MLNEKVNDQITFHSENTFAPFFVTAQGVTQNYKQSQWMRVNFSNLFKTNCSASQAKC